MGSTNGIVVNVLLLEADIGATRPGTVYGRFLRIAHISICPAQLGCEGESASNSVLHAPCALYGPQTLSSPTKTFGGGAPSNMIVLIIAGMDRTGNS